MDEKSVNDLNISEETKAPEAEEPKPAKKKKTLKRVLITLAILLLIPILLVGIALFAADRYLDHMLDYISYDVSDEEEWSGVDIDDPSYDIDYDDMGIDTSTFVDPELGRDESDSSLGETSEDETSDIGSSGGSSGSSGSSGGSSGTVVTPPAPPYEPDYEIIEGLFDGENISDAYDADVINILLIGADTMSGNYARSDTMILMSINNVKKRIVFTSFMRDTYVSIPGYKDNRLNAAHSAGGPKLLMKTITQNFGIKIDYYVKVSLQSFEMAVDVIGGIDLTVNSDNYNYFGNWQGVAGLSEAEATDGTHTVHLNGGQALGYARSRAYASGDFVRTLHQRDLLTQFARNCAGKSLTELHELLKAVLPYVSTNMPKEMLKMLVWNAIEYVSYDITDARVPCAGSFEFARITGREVLVINFDANIKYIKAKIYG